MSDERTERYAQLQADQARIEAQLLALENAPRNIHLCDEFPQTLCWLQEELLKVNSELWNMERGL